MALKTNYKEDILNTAVNTKRKYNMINNSDGTVSFEDVTAYTQVGDTFGAADINNTNSRIEEVFQCASDGKALIAEAVTGKGIETSADDTYEQMSNNIASIPVGVSKCYASHKVIERVESSGHDWVGTVTNDGVSLEANATYIVTLSYHQSVEHGSAPGVNYLCSWKEVAFPSGATVALLNEESYGGIGLLRNYKVDTADVGGVVEVVVETSKYYDRNVMLVVCALC